MGTLYRVTMDSTKEPWLVYSCRNFVLLSYRVQYIGLVLGMLVGSSME